MKTSRREFLISATAFAALPAWAKSGAEQRLFLFNSGLLERRLARQTGSAEELYWQFFGRAPPKGKR